MDWIFPVCEWGITALYLCCAAVSARQYKRDGGRSLYILLAAAIYAFLFENINVLSVTGRGSYSYNPEFQVFFYQVPMFIVLAWAVILWSAMRISDGAQLPIAARVANDAILAVWLDLSFDATAIRHSFWYWHGVGFDQAWFGVPAGNFFGWLFVSLSFSVCARGLAHVSNEPLLKSLDLLKLALQVLVAPVLALVAYKLVEFGNNRLLAVLHLTSDREALTAFFALYGAILLVALLARPYERTIQGREPRRTYLPRAPFHLFALGGLLAYPSAAFHHQKYELLGLCIVIFVMDELYLRMLERYRGVVPNVQYNPAVATA